MMIWNVNIMHRAVINGVVIGWLSVEDLILAVEFLCILVSQVCVCFLPVFYTFSFRGFN